MGDDGGAAGGAKGDATGGTAGAASGPLANGPLANGTFPGGRNNDGSAIAAAGVTGVTASIRVIIVEAGSLAAMSQVTHRTTPLNTHMRQMNVPHVAHG